MPVTLRVTRRRGCVLPGTPVSLPGTDLGCAGTGLDLGRFLHQGNALHGDRSQLLHPDLDSPFDPSEQLEAEAEVAGTWPVACHKGNGHHSPVVHPLCPCWGPKSH